MIWLIFAVLTACVILGITRSLRHASSSEDARTSEVEAYKLQLNELDREEERGTLGKEEAQQTRAEVSRRLLRASRQSVEASSKKPRALNAAMSFIAVAAVVSLGSIGTYVYYGKPGIPDQPLEARLNAPLGDQNSRCPGRQYGAPPEAEPGRCDRVGGSRVHLFQGRPV